MALFDNKTLEDQIKELQLNLQAAEATRLYLLEEFKNQRMQEYQSHRDQVKELNEKLRVAETRLREMTELKIKHQQEVAQLNSDLQAYMIDTVELPLEPLVEQVPFVVFKQLQQRQQDPAMVAAAEDFTQMEQQQQDAAIEAAAEEFARMEQDADVDAAIAAAAEEIARFEQEAEMTGNVNAAKPVAVVALMKQESVEQEPEPGFNETELRQGWYSDD